MTITIKKIVKISFINLRASAVTVSPFPPVVDWRAGIFSIINGINTVTDAKEAIEIKIKSGTRKAA